MKTLIALGALIGVFILTAVVVLSMGVGFHNKEVKLRNLLTAKQTDNKNEMDAMWKTIGQTAQVAEKDRDSLLAIFRDYATARSGGSDNKAPLMKWVTESCPQVAVNSQTFEKLMNIIQSQRDGFKFRQKELLDFKREHDNLLDTFPNNVFATVLHRTKIEVVIVTSTRTDNAFKSGKDDDVQLFQNKSGSTTAPAPQPAEKP